MYIGTFSKTTGSKKGILHHIKDYLNHKNMFVSQVYKDKRKCFGIMGNTEEFIIGKFNSKPT